MNDWLLLASALHLIQLSNAIKFGNVWHCRRWMRLARWMEMLGTNEERTSFGANVKGQSVRPTDPTHPRSLPFHWGLPHSPARIQLIMNLHTRFCIRNSRQAGRSRAKRRWVVKWMLLIEFVTSINRDHSIDMGIKLYVQTSENQVLE